MSYDPSSYNNYSNRNKNKNKNKDELKNNVDISIQDKQMELKNRLEELMSGRKFRWDAGVNVKNPQKTLLKALLEENHSFIKKFYRDMSVVMINPKGVKTKTKLEQFWGKFAFNELVLMPLSVTGVIDEKKEKNEVRERLKARIEVISGYVSDKEGVYIYIYRTIIYIFKKKLYIYSKEIYIYI